MHQKIHIVDSKFGNLFYHKNYLGKEKFNGESYLCEHPFTYAEIRLNGNVNVCCPDWNPAPIGNLLEDDLETIWNSEKANLIRQTILDGSYRFCNYSVCPKIINASAGRLIEKTDDNTSNLIQKLEKSRTPEYIFLVVDRSCNLECPSCNP